MNTLNLDASVEQIDLKKNPLTEDQLNELYRYSKSYEVLFSKRAQLYKQRGLKDQTLTEADYRSLLLEHYTFLKRPVLLYDQTLFVGNSSKVIDAAKSFLNEQ
jgi:arsenate reductase